MRGNRPYSRMQSTPNPVPPALPITSQRPTSSEPCANIAQFLMLYHMGSDDEFGRKAIESLIKKLKDKRDELDALILTVSSQGKIATNCITIPRTLDGRLQVAGRKGFPHVVYARIWRWPDLHKNELKHLSICRSAFDLKCEHVCVNPYHYERVVPPGIGTLDLSKLKIEQRSSQDDPLSPSHEGSPKINRRAVENNDAVAQKLAYASTSYAPPNVRLPTCSDAQGGSQMIPTQNSGTPWYSVTEQPAHVRLPPTLPMPYPGVSGVACVSGNVDPRCPGSHRDAVGTAPQQIIYNSAISSPDVGHMQPMIASTYPNPCIVDPHVATMERKNANLDVDNFSAQPPPTHWCMISYHEHTTKVGKTFLGDTPQIFVDGGLDDTIPGRFCLNTLPNLERSEVVERVRAILTRGIVLELKENGDVYMQNLLEKNCVYAESSYLTWMSPNKTPGCVIYRVLPAAEIKVFDLKYCIDQLRTWRDQQMVATDAENMLQLSEENKRKILDVGVDNLQRLCTINVSFIKGYGADYDRKSVEECPCWIEIKICRGLQFLDSMLNLPSAS